LLALYTSLVVAVPLFVRDRFIGSRSRASQPRGSRAAFGGAVVALDHDLP